MSVRSLLLAGALLLALPPITAAATPPSDDTAQTRAQLAALRAQMKTMAAQLAELSHKLGEPAPRAFAYRYLARPDAGQLGLVLKPDGDTLDVLAVTPGAPAEKAGVDSDDAIVAIDGKPVAGHAFDALRKLASSVKAGQKVILTLRRGNRQRTVSVTATHRDRVAWDALVSGAQTLRDALAGVDFHKIVADARRDGGTIANALRAVAPWWGLHLAPVNPSLGRYFGADHGALLLDNDSDLPGLEAGDVITRVGDQRIARPEDVIAALEQHAGDKVAMTIMRDHAARTLTIEAKPPAILLPPLPPAPPAPPRAPVAPAPPPRTSTL